VFWQEADFEYRARLSVHNGRTFVGAAVTAVNLTLQHDTNILEVEEDLLVEGIPLDTQVRKWTSG
jgi:hypothetical protein